MNPELLNALLKPVLEVKFLVLGAHGLNEITGLYGEGALLENIKTRSGWVCLHLFSSFSL